MSDFTQEQRWILLGKDKQNGRSKKDTRKSPREAEKIQEKGAQRREAKEGDRPTSGVASSPRMFESWRLSSFSTRSTRKKESLHQW